MKKGLALFFTLVLISLTVVACGSSDGLNPTNPPDSNNQPQNIEPLGKYDPPIEMSVGLGRIDADVNFPSGDSPENNNWTRMIRDELGINLKVIYAMPKGEELNQRINALIVSKTLPETFNVDGGGLQQLDQLIEAGAVEDLTELFDKYATPLTKQILPADALKPVLRNGKLYAIPYMTDPSDDGFMTWIRMDWLKQLNLPEPESFQDVLKIAEAFKAMDSKNYGFVATNVMKDMYGLGGFFSAFHAYPNIWMKDDSGKLVNGITLPEMKTALQKLQEQNKNGMLSKEWMVNNSSQTYQDLINGRVGVYFAKYWAAELPLQSSIEKDPNAEWKAFPFMSADGKPALSAKNALKVSSYYVVRKGAKNPEAFIKMLNLFTEKYFGSNPIVDPTKSNLFKVPPVSVERYGNNVLMYRAISEAMQKQDTSKLRAQEKQFYDDIMDYKNNGKVAGWWVEQEYGVGGSLQIYDYYSDNNLWIINEFYGAPTKSMPLKQGNLDKLVTEMIISIINGADINTYDTFVENWKKQGGDDITKEINEWFANK